MISENNRNEILNILKKRNSKEVGAYVQLIKSCKTRLIKNGN
jgi:hypothetical protein